MALSLFYYSCLKVMPKRKDNVPTAAAAAAAVEQESTYTLESMTCRILPGMQAREYIVKSSSNPIHLLDVFVWSVALYLAQVTITNACYA